MSAGACVRLVLVVASLFGLLACTPATVRDVERIEHQVAPTPDPSGWRKVAPGQEFPAPPAPSHHHLRVVVGPPGDVDTATLAIWGTPLAAATVEGRAIDLGPVPRFVPTGAGSSIVVQLGDAPTTYVPRFYVGSQRSLWTFELRREIPELLVGGTLVLTGLLFLVVTLRSRAARAYRGLGLFLASLGVVVIMILPVVRYLFLASMPAILGVHGAAKLLYPLGLIELVLAVFGDTRHRLLQRGRWPYLVYAVAALGAHVTGRMSLAVSGQLVNVFTLYVSAVAIALALPRARSGDRAARTFLQGYVALLVLATPDLLDGMGLLLNPFQTLPWAILAFGAAMTTVIQRRHAENETALQESHARLTTQLDELEHRNREISTLNTELRHQIAERSRQMADALQQRATQPPSASRALQPGDELDGRYTVLRALGRGGMGAVYEVERKSDGRHLALKVMANQATSQASARFAREAEIAARLASPHLVSVVDVSGVTSERLYLVMELVDGASLEDRRERFGDVPWALPVLAGVARGLAALHRASVVHRDLKPANVLLPAAGGVKISDFGISAFARDGEDVEDDTTPADGLGPTVAARSPGLTGTGVVLGTPAYMAPELAQGSRRARAPADMYAFGLMAYEVLSGKAAFATPPIYAALAGTTPPPPAPLPADVPAALAAKVLQCLATRPDDRPTADELVAAG